MTVNARTRWTGIVVAALVVASVALSMAELHGARAKGDFLVAETAVAMMRGVAEAPLEPGAIEAALTDVTVHVDWFLHSDAAVRMGATAAHLERSKAAAQGAVELSRLAERGVTRVLPEDAPRASAALTWAQASSTADPTTQTTSDIVPEVAIPILMDACEREAALAQESLVRR